MVTITDVAARAGVSTATVSRVLNGHPVRQPLRDAVNLAISELRYSPDRTARSLRSRQTQVIGLVIPSIENPFFTAVARGVEDVAAEVGYSVVLCNTDDEPAKEEQYLRIAAGEKWAGVLLAAADDRPRIQELLARGHAIVAIDRAVPDEVDQVMFDNVKLGAVATRELLARGYRRIACVTGPKNITTALERAQGWRAALAVADIDPAPEMLIHANFRVDGGYEAAEELLAAPLGIDAILATNNLVGVGVLRALADRGRLDDVGVRVIGELPFATSHTSAVDVTPLNPGGLGALATRMLLERIAGLDDPPRRIVQQTDDGPAPERSLSPTA